METYNFISLSGIFVLIGLAWLISSDRKNINSRVLVWGVSLQLVFAAAIFLFPFSEQIFLLLNKAVIAVLSAASAGSEFMFGRLALSPLGFFLAFQAFPTIIFFSALISVFYHWGIMQKLVKGFAFVFTKTMKISGAESLCAASNIFVGVESAVTVRPYLERMTKSEFCTVLTAGMATVASNVLALYVIILSGSFPTIAGHLISASILSAPAAVVMSKIIMPETGKPETMGLTAEVSRERDGSFFESIINGADAGLKLIFGITALLIAVLGLTALADLMLSSAGSIVNGYAGISFDWSLKSLLGILFYPIAIVIGIPPSDALEVGRLIGERAVMTEIPAYQNLALMMKEGAFSHGRSSLIAAYALCGFTHIASMAIFVGGVSALAPSRTADIARVGFRALIAATLACLMTGCVAGVFYTGSHFLSVPVL